MSTFEESETLLTSSKRKKKSNNGKGFTITKHGMFSVFLLIVLGGVSIYMDYEITTLQTQLDVAKENVAELEGVVAEHSSVIQRFNCEFECGAGCR